VSTARHSIGRRELRAQNHSVKAPFGSITMIVTLPTVADIEPHIEHDLAPWVIDSSPSMPQRL